VRSPAQACSSHSATSRDVAATSSLSLHQLSDVCPPFWCRILACPLNLQDEIVNATVKGASLRKPPFEFEAACLDKVAIDAYHLIYRYTLRMVGLVKFHAL
jgi:hypothetical protein